MSSELSTTDQPAGWSSRLTQHLGGDPITAALRLLGLASLMLTLSTETLPMIQEFRAESPGATPWLMLLLASQVLAAVALLLPVHHRVTPWVLLAMLIASLSGMMRTAGEFEVVEYILPGYWFFPLLALAMREKERRTYLAFAAGGALSLIAVQIRHVGLEDAPSWADVVWILQPIALVLLFGDAIISLDRARDASVASQELAALEQERAQREASDRQYADRLVNGHILGALSAITEAPTSQRASELCARAQANIRQAMERTRLVPLEQAIGALPLVQRLGATVTGTTEPIDEQTAQTITRAVDEALRNVADHARASSVTVEVSGHGDHRSVTVSDDGVGFDPTHVEMDRLNGGSSIFRTMEQIGGQAAVSSAPGEGTRVALDWPRTARPEDWRDAPNRLVRVRLTRSAWPTLVTSLLMALLLHQEVSHPAAGLVLGLATAIGGIVLAAVLTRRALPGPVLVGLAGVAGAAWLANLALVPESPDSDYALWMAWTASAVVHLLVLSATLRFGTAIAAAWAVVQYGSMALMYGAEAAWEHSFLLITGPGDVLITLLVLWVARAGAAQEAEAAQRAIDLRAATARAQLAGSVQRFWSPLVREEAIPLIEAVAEGREEATDALVRSRAHALAEEIRDTQVARRRA